MARKWGVKMGRPAGSEYLRIPEDTGCVAAPKCLTCPEPKCLEDMTYGERVKWNASQKRKEIGHENCS